MTCKPPVSTVGLAHTRFLGGIGLARGRFSLCFHTHKNTYGYRQVYGVVGSIKNISWAIRTSSKKYSYCELTAIKNKHAKNNKPNSMGVGLK